MVGEGRAEETLCTKPHRNAKEAGGGTGTVRMAGGEAQEAARHM